MSKFRFQESCAPFFNNKVTQLNKDIEIMGAKGGDTSPEKPPLAISSKKDVNSSLKQNFYKKFINNDSSINSSNSNIEAEYCHLSHDLLFFNGHDRLSFYIIKQFQSRGVTKDKIDELKNNIQCIFPWEDRYHKYRFNSNRDFDIYPWMIVFPSRTSHVKNIIRWIKIYKIPFSIRSGGYCCSGRSLISGAVIDLSLKNKISFLGVNSDDKERENIDSLKYDKARESIDSLKYNNDNSKHNRNNTDTIKYKKHNKGSKKDDHWFPKEIMFGESSWMIKNDPFRYNDSNKEKKERKEKEKSHQSKDTKRGNLNTLQEGRQRNHDQQSSQNNLTKNCLVKFETGVRIGTLLSKCQEYGIGIPTSFNPDESASGFYLAGGLGPYSRSYGIGADRIVEIEIVTSDGEVKKCNEKSENIDLFWALKGSGGSNLGVVTSMTVKGFPLKEVVIYDLFYNLENLSIVGDLWQRTSPIEDLNLSSYLLIHKDFIRIFGFYIGDKVKLADLLSPYLRIENKKTDSLELINTSCVKPLKREMRTVSLLDAQRWLTESIPLDSWNKEKSGFIESYLPDDGFHCLEDHIKISPNDRSYILLSSMGGNIVALEDDATAYSIRDGMVALVSFYTSWNQGTNKQDSISWIEQFYKNFAGYLNGYCYTGILDTSMEFYETRYFNEPNTNRLKHIKHKYDPENLFLGGIPLIINDL